MRKKNLSCIAGFPGSLPITTSKITGTIGHQEKGSRTWYAKKRKRKRTVRRSLGGGPNNSQKGLLLLVKDKGLRASCTMGAKKKNQVKTLLRNKNDKKKRRKKKTLRKGLEEMKLEPGQASNQGNAKNWKKNNIVGAKTKLDEEEKGKTQGGMGKWGGDPCCSKNLQSHLDE